MDESINRKIELMFIVVGVLGIVTAGFLFLPGVISGMNLGPKDNSFKMVAELKGSIYGRGDQVSVWGTCRDVNGEPVDALGYFSAWYPNGTQFIYDDGMSSIGAGVYLWTGAMSNVGGTYLTQIKCSYLGTVAYANGEWQNPLWVRQIEEGYATINDTYVNTEIILDRTIELNDTLVQINGTIVNEHNITRTYIGNQFNYTNDLITQVGVIANGSVDRNDSLLYRMLYYLMLQAGYPISGNVTYEVVSMDNAVYYNNWTLEIKALDEYNQIISYPNVDCYMSSSVAPTIRMLPSGEHFLGTIFLGTILDNFTVDVTCSRII